MRIKGFRRVKVEGGRAYLRQGFTGTIISEKRIQSVQPITGTKTRVIPVKRGKQPLRANITETTMEKAKKGFANLVRMRSENVPHVLYPVGFKVDRKRRKGYLFTLHRPGHPLRSPEYKRLGYRKKMAVAAAVLDSIREVHEKGWILRDRNASNIIFHFTPKGRVRITHIDPFTALKFVGKKEHREELMNREMRYIFSMLSELG